MSDKPDLSTPVLRLAYFNQLRAEEAKRFHMAGNKPRHRKKRVSWFDRVIVIIKEESWRLKQLSKERKK